MIQNQNKKKERNGENEKKTTRCQKGEGLLNGTERVEAQTCGFCQMNERLGFGDVQWTRRGRKHRENGKGDGRRR
jgi:hypothetical protein